MHCLPSYLIHDTIYYGVFENIARILDNLLDYANNLPAKLNLVHVNF